MQSLGSIVTIAPLTVATVVAGLLGSVAEAQSFGCEAGLPASGLSARARDVVDFDGDGDGDVLWFLVGGNLAAIARNDGDGAFTPRNIQLFDTLRDVRPADIDGDGDADVFYAQTLLGTDRIGWLRNPGDLTSIGLWFADEIEGGLQSSGIAYLGPGDVDGDGDTDVMHSTISLFGASQDVAVHLNDGTGGTWTKVPLGAIGQSSSLWAADLDGDGDTDFATGGPEITWLDNTAGNGTSWNLVPVTTSDGQRNARPADVDNDGDVDLLASDFGTPRTFWVENVDGLGTAWFEHDIGTYGYDPLPADVDLDGDVDVFRASGGVGWFENTAGDGSAWTDRVITSALGAGIPQDLAVGDLNGDPRPDLVVTGNNLFVSSLVAFESVPSPELLAYGCGVNPAGSLAPLSGEPNLGTTVTVGVGNPLGGHPAGSLAFLGISSAPDAAFPCGTLVPGLGMTPGAPGALLIDFTFPEPIVLAGPVYDGVNPAPIAIFIPNEPSLAGVSYYAQGGLLAPAGPGTAGIGVTDALEVRIGAACAP